MNNNIIYRYYPLEKSNEINFIHLKNLLEKQELYFPSSKELNDPFDCYIKSKYDGTPNELKVYAKSNPDTKAGEELLKMFEENEYNLEKINDSLLFVNQSYEIPQFVISCFTKLRDSILMWSHYASKHTGVCIGFKCEYQDDESFIEMSDDILYKEKLCLYKVKYSDNYPRFFNPVKDTYNDMRKFYLTKFKKWEYEDEYRAILYYIRRRESDKIYKFKKEILSEIIFGLRTDTNYMIKIKDIVNKEYIREQINVKYLKAIRNGSQYKMEFTKVDWKELWKYNYKDFSRYLY